MKPHIRKLSSGEYFVADCSDKLAGEMAVLGLLYMKGPMPDEHSFFLILGKEKDAAAFLLSRYSAA